VCVCMWGSLGGFVVRCGEGQIEALVELPMCSVEFESWGAMDPGYHFLEKTTA